MAIAAGLGVLGSLLNSIGSASAAMSPSDLEQGRVIYQRHCADCHGAEGKGDGQQATSLSPRPGNLISAQTSAKSDQELLKIIAKGRPRTAMEGWEDRLSPRRPGRCSGLYPLSGQIYPLGHAGSPAAVIGRSPGAPFAPENPRGTVPVFISYLDSRSELVMIRLNGIARPGSVLAVLVAACLLFTITPADAASSKKKSKGLSPAASVALQYAEAISKGDPIKTGNLDFACQYRLLVAKQPHAASPAPSDASSDTCVQGLKAVHEPALARVDSGMDVLWPSNGALPFFRDDLDHYPASAFVMDAIGLSPPGSGLHLTAVSTTPLPNASFRVRPQAPLVSVPTTLVILNVAYQDPLTAPITKAPGSYKWTNTVKPARRAVKSLNTQWVVLSGLKKHGFQSDSAVVNLLVNDGTPVDGIPQEIIPFVTEFSKAITGSVVWWGPEDAPGLLVASAARAAGFPSLRDRVAMLNRVLIIDPNQAEALTVLTKDLYAAILREAVQAHKLNVKDPALAMAVNEQYWNVYAQGERLDLSLDMEMGGLEQPTTADYLYRLLPALRTLAQVRPEQLDNRFRWGVALRWNLDQDLSIEVHEQLVKDVPSERKTAKAEALLQLAWSRINKVAWNRNLDDKDVRAAYQDADQAGTFAEIPLDKFIAEYTMAYSLLFTPNRDNGAILQRLTEAKRWFGEVPGNNQQIWDFFIGADSLKSVLDADPIFQPLLASGAPNKG